MFYEIRNTILLQVVPQLEKLLRVSDLFNDRLKGIAATAVKAYLAGIIMNVIQTESCSRRVFKIYWKGDTGMESGIVDGGVVSISGNALLREVLP